MIFHAFHMNKNNTQLIQKEVETGIKFAAHMHHNLVCVI